MNFIGSLNLLFKIFQFFLRGVVVVYDIIRFAQYLFDLVYGLTLNHVVRTVTQRKY